MKGITYGLLWFQLLLMNIGLAMGTIGLVLLIINYSPLIGAGLLGIIPSLLYVFFYSLLVIGVIGIDLEVLQKGIKHVYELTKNA